MSPGRRARLDRTRPVHLRACRTILGQGVAREQARWLPTQRALTTRQTGQVAAGPRPCVARKTRRVGRPVDAKGTKRMPAARGVFALIAHDGKKEAMADFARRHRDRLAGYRLLATE